MSHHFFHGYSILPHLSEFILPFLAQLQGRTEFLPPPFGSIHPFFHSPGYDITFKLSCGAQDMEGELGFGAVSQNHIGVNEVYLNIQLHQLIAVMNQVNQGTT